MLLGPRSIAVSHRVVLCIAQFPGGSVGPVRMVGETEACSLCPDDSVLGGNGRYTPLRRDATNALRKRSTATGIPLSPSVPSARQRHWSQPSTTPHCEHTGTSFEVIHPHHPLRGQKFQLVTYRNNWGEDRVYFHDAEGRLRSIPASWTTAVAKDPFVAMAGGRCPFRFQDLLKVVELVEKLGGGSRPCRKGNYAASVKKNMPDL